MGWHNTYALAVPRGPVEFTILHYGKARSQFTVQRAQLTTLLAYVARKKLDGWFAKECELCVVHRPQKGRWTRLTEADIERIVREETSGKSAK